MSKRILFLMLISALTVSSAGASDLSDAEKAYINALAVIPASYEYKEESGALIFTQKKNYRFDIIENGNDIKQLVTFSSTNNEKKREEDPRPPVREGDCTDFCMRRLLCESDIFDPQSRLSKISGGTESISGKMYSVIELSYRYRDEYGMYWPMSGRLFVEQTSGMPFRFVCEQQDFPDDLYSLSAEIDFKGSCPSECRIAEYRKNQTGQYGIFRYRYYYVLSFTY